MYRLGTESFAVLARAIGPATSLLKRLGMRHSVEPVRLRRGRRAWRALTAGLIVARAAYGEQVKRWYARGLPPAEKLEWSVEKKAMEKPWNRITGSRVRTANNVILVPPEIWRMSKNARKQYQTLAAQTFTPEQARANRIRLAQIIRRTSANLILTAPAQPALTREAVREWYAMKAKQARAGASSIPDPALNPSTLLGGGLRSSIHSGGAGSAEFDAVAESQWLHSGAPPPLAGRERDYEDWLDEVGPSGRTRRAVFAENDAKARDGARDRRKLEAARKINEALESLRKKLQGG